jgi:hypothetical protein
MKLNDISKPTNAAALNENLAKTFGQKINTDEFTLEQLYDARNRVRTQMRNIETMESFNATNNDKYQRQLMLHDVLNAAINERMDDEQVDEITSGYSDTLGNFQKLVQDVAAKTGKSTVELAKFTVGGLMDLMKQGGDTVTKAYRKQKVGHGKGQTIPTGVQAQQVVKNRKATGQFQKNSMYDEGIVYTKGSKLREGAQEQAELVMASKELVDTVGKWLQDTAEMQSESMLKLTDAIRDELGQEQADSFQQSVKPTLEALYQALEASRTALTQGVSLLTGEGAPAPEMGAEAPVEGGEEMAAEPEMEPVEGGEEMAAEMGDEFAGAEAAGGGTVPEGREQRESRIPLSHKLGTILSSKKK